MGNEMGNNNVTGSQNQDNTEFEAPVISSEASVGSVNVNDDQPEKNPVAPSKESDLVEDTTLNFKDPPGISHPQAGKEALDHEDMQAPSGSSGVPFVTNDTNDEENQSILSSKDEEIGSNSQHNSPKRIDQKTSEQQTTAREINNDEVQVTHESSKAQLLPNNTSNLEPQPILSSKALEGSSETSGTHIQDQTFVMGEMRNTEIEATKEFLEALLVQKDLKDEQPQLVQTCDHNSLGEDASTSENNPSGTSDQQFQNQTVEDGAGEEILNLFLNTNQEYLDNTEIQPPNGSSRVPTVTNDTNNEENQSILSSRNEEIGSYLQQNSPQRIDQKTQEQQTIVREVNGDEVYVPHESSKAFLLPNDTSNLEWQPVPSSETLKQTVSASCKDSSETSVTRTQEQTFVMGETGNTNIEVPNGFLEDQRVQKNLNIDERPQMVQTCEGNSLEEEASTSENNEQHKNQISITKDRAEEEMVNSFLDTRSVTDIQEQAFVMQETGKADFGAAKDFLEAQLVQKDLKEEPPQLLEINEDNFLGEEAAASENNPSGTRDQQFQNQTLKGGDKTEEEMMISFLDGNRESLESADVKSDTEELNSICVESPNKPRNRPTGNHEVEDNEPHESDGEVKNLKHEIDQKPEGSITAAVGSIVWEDELDTQKMEKKEDLPDIGINKRKLKNEASGTSPIDSEEQEDPKLLDKSNMDSQLEVVQSAKSIEPIKVPVSECNKKFEVPDDVTKAKMNRSETEQNKKNLNPFSICKGLKEESHVSNMEPLTTDFMMIGTDHHENSSGTKVHGLHISKTEIKHKVDENKTTENGYEVNLHENGVELEKMAENIVNNGSSPIKFTTADSIMLREFPHCFSPSCDFNKEIPTDGTGDSHTEQEVLEERGMIEQVSFQSDHREPAADISVFNFPVLEEKSKNVVWDQSLLITEMKENGGRSTIESKQEKCCNEVNVPNQTSNIINYTGDHDSQTDLFTAEGKENLNAQSKQKEEFSSKVYNKSEFSFDLGILLTEIDQVQIPQWNKQDSDQHKSIPHGQPMNTKDGKCPLRSDTEAKHGFENKSALQPPTDVEDDGIGSFLGSDLQPKESVNTSTKPKTEKVSIHAEVTALLSSNARTEDSDQRPLLYNQEESIEKDVFELKSYGNAALASKLGVTAADADSKTDQLTTTNPRKEVCSPEKVLQGQEFLSGKQVIAWEHSESGKLKIPLLSFMKEKSNIMGSIQKQENPNDKKATEDMRNPVATETRDHSPPGREKRKTKSSFFSNCICCAAVIE